MQAKRYLEKHFMVLPVLMVAINSLCYTSIFYTSQGFTQKNSAAIFYREIPKKLPQYHILCNNTLPKERLSHRYHRQVALQFMQ